MEGTKEEKSVPLKNSQESEKSNAIDKRKEAKQNTENKAKSKTVRKLKITIGLLVLFIFFIVFLLGSALLKKTATLPSSDANKMQENYTKYYGIIGGSLSYPSDFIPEMGVCAKNKKTKEEFCPYEMIEDEKYKYGFGYSMEIPAGTYSVYAQLTDPKSIGAELGKNYKAYYSKFVTCGMSVECKSHKPIDVKVSGGKTISNVDPQDWYAGN